MEEINSEENVNASKLLHFSDGVMEFPLNESSEPTSSNSCEVDPKSMNWGPWVAHMALQASGKALEVCDYLGESIASFLGITTPKYQLEINEYYRMKKEEEEERKKDLEMGAWSGVVGQDAVITNQVHSSPQLDRTFVKNIQPPSKDDNENRY